MNKQKVIDKLKDDPLMPLRHSAEHVLHKSMEILYPGLQKVMGPPIEDGFYFDYNYEGKVSEEDLSKMEAKMQEIIDADLPIVVRKSTFDELRKIFKDNEFKLELIDDLEQKGEKVTVTEMGKEGDEFYDIDLCAGPHIKSTGKIKAFKLLNLAGAYWRGDEKNKMLGRIYGTAFDSKDKLGKYLENLEEAKKRDHRRIGKDLELFMQDDEVGQGLILWLPKGAYIMNKVKDFAFNTYLDRGYEPVFTPHIASEKLWSHSGHLDFYSESMYNPFGIENEQYRLKPMNCPLQVKMYNYRPRSYRELPLRWTEMGTVYRYEKSGTLHGLTRVRGFTQDDAHIVCTPDQIEDELVKALELTFYILETMGFKEFELLLSVRNLAEKEKYVGDDGGWNMAEKTLVKAMKRVGCTEYTEDAGGAVFYGPKIDFNLKDSLGRKWQLSTIQFDFNLPRRFNMTYIGEDGKEHVPYLIHRALLGSLERFMGVYIEHTGGAFPVWVCPQHIEIIPINDSHIKYAQKLTEKLRENGLLAKINDKDNTMQAKIRDAQLQKIPYMFIVGDREVESNTVSVRLRSGENLGSKSIEEVMGKIKNIYLTKSLELW
ncbi:threonine--tRNA ligase [Patescibacteria group bacterium]|nr:threonine--tRNA ligase [Patescibacteria group bacterium]